MSPRDLAVALSAEWANMNERLFGGALLNPATIVVRDDDLHHAAGEWIPSVREIRFSAAFVTERPWWVVREALKHEMAHQYVSDVLGVGEEETAHSTAFQMVCERYAIDGRASHKPTEAEARIVDKVRKLLALSTSPNANEAEAALAAARKLLGQHGLAEADVRERDSEEFGALAIGPILPRLSLHHRVVASILGTHFRVRCIWLSMCDPRTRTMGHQLEVAGKRSDVAMAEYVHGWLHQVAEQLCPSNLSRKARADFIAGVMAGHMERLGREAAETVAVARGQSVAVVRVPEDGDLDAYFERRHPARRSIRSSRRALSSSFLDGAAKGRGLTMNRPIADSGPKLLGK